MKEINISINLSLSISDEVQNVHFEQSMKSLMALARFGSVTVTKQHTECVLFCDYMRSRLHTEDLCPSTIRNRQSTIVWVERLYPNLLLAEVKPEFINEFTAQLKSSGLSINTIAKHVSHLRVFLLQAARKGLISSCWLDASIYSQKHGPFRHSFLSKEELKMLETLDLTRLHRASRTIVQAFLFCCYTGLRFSDVVQLSHKHLEHCDGASWINLCMKKTGNPIRIPLSELFDGKGMRIIAQQSHRPLYETTRLFPIANNEYANRVLKKIFARLGVRKHITFHTSRHTFATLCLNAGVKLEVIQVLLGHHSIKTTQIYATMTNQMVVDSLRKVTW